MGKWGKEEVELFLGEADDVGGGSFSEFFEVELCNGTESLVGGCGSKWGWRSDDVRVGIDGGGFKSVWVDEGDASTG